MDNFRGRTEPPHLVLHDPAIAARPDDDALPDGKLRMVVTFLQMIRRPSARQVPHPSARIALLRAEKSTASFYHYLYDAVGAPWMWYERRLMSDETLLKIIHDERVEIFVLYVHGVPAGYVELDRRVSDEVEIAYFGLVPEFIGRGLGRFFMSWAVDAAWERPTNRVWVHTCNFDHPRAVAAYQRAGFVPYRQESRIIDDPRLAGAFRR